MTDKISLDQYGRRTWDVEAYEKEAKGTKPKEEDDISISKSLAIKDNTSSNSLVAHRNKLLQSSLSAVKTYNIINPASTGSSYGKDKRFGFFCPICNLSFRDNLALIDHLNSPQHVAKANQLSSNQEGYDDASEVLDGGIKRASLQQVVLTLESLVAKSIRDKTKVTEGLTFEERVLKRVRFEEQKRDKRKTKRQRKGESKQQEKPEESDISSLIGFASFGSTKK